MRVAWDRAPPVRRAAYGSERVPARGIRRAAGSGQHLREHQSRPRASAIAPGPAETVLSTVALFFHHKDTKARRRTTFFCQFVMDFWATAAGTVYGIRLHEGLILIFPADI